MVFASLTFLYLFLPLGLALYFLCRATRARNAVLVALSFAFYAWGEPVWVTLLFASAGADYVHGLLIERTRGSRWGPRAVLVSSLVFNLGLLVAFKYAGFFAANVNAVLGTELEAPAVSLPVGISFYTFQTISYVVDVHRGEVRAQRSFGAFLMYVSMFPQLVAGPIVRYAEVEAQLFERRTTLRDVSEGGLPLRRGPLQEGLPGQRRGRDRRALPRRRPHEARGHRGLVRSARVHLPDLLRLLRLLGHGDRPRARLRLPLPRELRAPVHRAHRHGVLAAMAHHALALLPRLRLHPARRQPALARPQPLRRLDADGALARRELELRALGRVLRRPALRGAPGPPSRARAAPARRLPRLPARRGDPRLGALLLRRHEPPRRVRRRPVPRRRHALTSVELHTTVRTHAFWLVLAVVLSTPLPSMARAWASRALARAGERWQPLAAADAALNVTFLLASTAMLVGHTYNPFLYFRF
ncbi:MAG: hypothetical protein M5U28_33380 [Sandaracinaceae bacterium]|nr:hypothetical protein [Sandaracinaceae bacterium]